MDWAGAQRRQMITDKLDAAHKLLAGGLPVKDVAAALLASAQTLDRCLPGLAH